MILPNLIKWWARPNTIVDRALTGPNSCTWSILCDPVDLYVRLNYLNILKCPLWFLCWKLGMECEPKYTYLSVLTRYIVLAMCCRHLKCLLNRLPVQKPLWRRHFPWQVFRPFPIPNPLHHCSSVILKGRNHINIRPTNVTLNLAYERLDERLDLRLNFSRWHISDKLH